MTGVWPPSGHLWRAPTSIRLQSRSRLFAKGHLWPRGTASFARPLPPKRCGLPRASLLGPRQSDFGRIDISTGKGALGSMQWNVDHCPVAMQLKKPAAVDGPYEAGATEIVEGPLGRTVRRARRLSNVHDHKRLGGYQGRSRRLRLRRGSISPANQSIAKSGEVVRGGAMGECVRTDAKGRIVDTQYRLITTTSNGH
jgi:hypothetical protein